MTGKLDFYKAYYKASWANPPASVLAANQEYLADDFHTYDNAGNVEMDKQAYIGMTQLLLSGFKDFKAVYSDIHEEGDSIIVTYHFEGIHTGDLDLSAMGLGIIPPSGKKIVWPANTAAFGIEDNKIVSIRSIGNSGGVASFLEPLGIKMPND